MTSPGGSESPPTSSAGAARSTEPGPDTRWTALNQLIPSFSHPLDEGSTHGPNKLAVTGMHGMPSLPAPVQEASLSPALIHQPNTNLHEPVLELPLPLITTETVDEQTADLGLQIGMSELAAADAWAESSRHDPWASGQINRIDSLSMVAEPDTSAVQLDADSCFSLGGMTATEEETVHGEPLYIYRGLAPHVPCIPVATGSAALYLVVAQLASLRAFVLRFALFCCLYEGTERTVKSVESTITRFSKRGVVCLASGVCHGSLCLHLLHRYPGGCMRGRIISLTAVSSVRDVRSACSESPHPPMHCITEFYQYQAIPGFAANWSLGVY